MIALILALHFLIHPLLTKRVIYSCNYTNCVANIGDIAVHFTTAKPITVQQIMRSNGKITPNMFIKPKIITITGVPFSFSYIKTATQQALLQMQKQGVIESKDANSVQFPPLDISGFQTSTDTGLTYNFSRQQSLSATQQKQHAIQYIFITRFCFWIAKQEKLKPTPTNLLRIAYTITQDINTGKTAQIQRAVTQFLLSTAKIVKPKIVKKPKKPVTVIHPSKPKPKPKKQSWIKKVLHKIFLTESLRKVATPPHQKRNIYKNFFPLFLEFSTAAAKSKAYIFLFFFSSHEEKMNARKKIKIPKKSATAYAFARFFRRLTFCCGGAALCFFLFFGSGRKIFKAQCLYRVTKKINFFCFFKVVFSRLAPLQPASKLPVATAKSSKEELFLKEVHINGRSR